MTNLKNKKKNSNKLSNFWEITLLIFALLFLVAYAFPAFFPNSDTIVYRYIDQFQWICYFIFAVDLIIGLTMSNNRIKYIRSHPIEIMAVLLPFLRPLRVLRFLSVSSLLFEKIALGRSITVTFRLAIASLLLLFVGAIEITLTERSVEGANIKSIGDGLWWATTTVTTVGYGDKFPVTLEGKFIAIGLMLVGIALIGAISATFAAWFINMMQSEKNNYRKS